jgi:hypothetical protein
MGGFFLGMNAYGEGWGQPDVARHVIHTHLNRRLLIWTASYVMASNQGQADIVPHILDTRLEPSFLEVDGLLEQWVGHP